MSLLNTEQHIRLENIGIRDLGMESSPLLVVVWIGFTAFFLSPLELMGGADIEQLELMESGDLSESLRSYEVWTPQPTVAPSLPPSWCKQPSLSYMYKK